MKYRIAKTVVLSIAIVAAQTCSSALADDPLSSEDQSQSSEWAPDESAGTHIDPTYSEDAYEDPTYADDAWSANIPSSDPDRTSTISSDEMPSSAKNYREEVTANDPWITEDGVLQDGPGHYELSDDPDIRALEQALRGNSNLSPFAALAKTFDLDLPTPERTTSVAEDVLLMDLVYGPDPEVARKLGESASQIEADTGGIFELLLQVGDY